MSEIVDDPFASSPADEDDPFADSVDAKVGGGAFTPRPVLEDLEGRLIIMVPRELDREAKTPQMWVDKGAKPTREQYTVDMVVLDGGPLTYSYRDKVVDGNTTRMEDKEYTVDTLPFMWSGVWRTEASIIGQLKKVDGTKKPMLLGVLRRGPQADDRRNGKTWQDIAAEFEKWRKNPRGAAPAFSWFVDVEAADVPANKELALQWWRGARESGYTLP
jgi:hypothetical protein